jgi:hypothetical protein
MGHKIVLLKFTGHKIALSYPATLHARARGPTRALTSSSSSALKAIGDAFDAAWAEISGRFGTDLAIEAARLKLANAVLSVANQSDRASERSSGSEISHVTPPGEKRCSTVPPNSNVRSSRIRLQP